MRNRRFLILAVTVLLLFWGTRLYQIQSFPPFIDEAYYVHYGEDILSTGPLAHSSEGRQFTFWWYILFQVQSAAQISAARIATVFALLPGIAATLGTARLFGSIWSAGLAGLLLIFSTYHFFFERLALADPISASAVMCALFFASRLSQRSRLTDAVLCGFALFIAIGAKISALPYLGIPIAAALTLRPTKSNWKSQLQWALFAVTVGVVLTGGFLFLTYARGYNPFLYLQGTPSTANADTYFGKITSAWLSVVGYEGLAAAVAFMVGVGVLLLRGKWFLPLCLFAPFAVLSISSRQDSRHLIAPFSILLLSSAVAVEYVSRKYRAFIRRGILALVTIWGAVVWLPFAFAAAHDPITLPLPQNDRNQYMMVEGTGFGLAEVVAYLQEIEPERTIGILANCPSLRYLAGSSLTIECPQLNPNGEDRATLTALMETNRNRPVYVVLEDIAYAPDSAPGEEVTVIVHPSGRPRLTIYDLSANP